MDSQPTQETPTPPKKGRPKTRHLWRPAEDARLTALYVAAGLSVRDCSAVLRRSPDAVEQRAHDLGLKWGDGALFRVDKAGVVARAREAALAEVPAIAREAMDVGRELAAGGAQLARAAIAEGDAKGYNHSTAGLERMNRMAVAGARGFESAGYGSGGDGGGVNVGLFFFGGTPEKAKEEKQVFEVPVSET